MEKLLNDWTTVSQDPNDLEIIVQDNNEPRSLFVLDIEPFVLRGVFTSPELFMDKGFPWMFRDGTKAKFKTSKFVCEMELNNKQGQVHMTLDTSTIKVFREREPREQVSKVLHFYRNGKSQSARITDESKSGLGLLCNDRTIQRGELIVATDGSRWIVKRKEQKGQYVSYGLKRTNEKSR